MGRRYRKKKNAPQIHSRHMAESAELRGAFLRLSESLERSEARAEALAPALGARASEIMDFREARRLLDSYPPLLRYLQDIQERADAIHEAEAYPLQKASPTAAAGSASLGGWSAYNEHNIAQGVNNARTLRDFVDQSEWVGSAINYYCDRIGRADIAVLPQDERAPYNRTVAKMVEHLLDNPNELGDTFPDLLGGAIRDYLTIGRGMLTKDMSTRRTPVSLYVEDAALIKIYPGWSGSPDQPRYLYQPDAQSRVPLRSDEVIAMLCGISSFRLSFSPVQVLRNTILADIKATQSAARLVDNKPPPHIVQLPGTSASEIMALRTKYDAEIAGHREVMFLGGPAPAQIKSMIYSLRDNQWMEWLEYLARKIFAVLGVSPQDFGLTFDINKATAGSQQEISENKGLIPLMLRIESYLNRQLLADFAPRKQGRPDMNALNLRIVFPEISESARILHAEKAIDMATRSLAGLPSQTLNQILLAQGLEPVKGGNTFYIKTATGAVPWLSYDEDFGPYTPSASSPGSQDPEGGVAADEESQDDMGNNASSDTGNQNGASSGNPSEEQDNGGSGGQDIQRDYRLPGMRWSPASLQRKSVSAAPTFPDAETRNHLRATDEQIFQQIEQRGGEKLRELL